MRLVTSSGPALAEAILLSGERVKVLKGSEARRNRKLRDGKTNMEDRGSTDRDLLILRGVLIPTLRDPDVLIFACDHEFTSPTAAADIVFGANKSGREYWVAKSDGKSLVEHFGASR